MRTLLSAIVACTLAAAVGLQAQQPPTPAPEQQPAPKKAPISIAGKWTMTLETAMGNGSPGLEIKQDGEKLTGTYTGRYGAAPLVGTIKDLAVEWTVNIKAEGTDVEMVFTGEVSPDGTAMRGDADLGAAGDATWLARKQKT